MTGRCLVILGVLGTAMFDNPSAIALEKIGVGWASDFKVGDYDAKGARVSFANLNLSEHGFTQRFAGLIGIDFL
jgi:hypothetical protein